MNCSCCLEGLEEGFLWASLQSQDRGHSWDSASQSFTLHSTQLRTGTHRDVQFPLSSHGLSCLLYVSAEAVVPGDSSCLFLSFVSLSRQSYPRGIKTPRLRPPFSLKFYKCSVLSDHQPSFSTQGQKTSCHKSVLCICLLFLENLEYFMTKHYKQHLTAAKTTSSVLNSSTPVHILSFTLTSFIFKL